MRPFARAKILAVGRGTVADPLVDVADVEQRDAGLPSAASMSCLDEDAPASGQ